ncbi:MAG: hypothetical protein J5874_06665 [Oscillospiraceae bacterium]|nr:hypothetical protein [Oscillospiraceae bacterium]
MYKISVPIMNCNVKRSNRERLLRELKRFNAERVFLALDTYETDEKTRENVLKDIKDNCEFFKDNGFEVGAWIWTFWVKNNTKFRNMRSVKGTEIKSFMCPTDEDFVKFSTDYISDIARCGVDLIQFDDDFRYGFLSDSAGCLCDRHIELINGITGRVSTREELEKHITSGGKNIFRDAYLKANGDAFRNFAAAVRAAVDKVDPKIRIGACACMSSWDIDGTDAFELAKILAGKTRPFVRLIGAPYWAVNKSWGNSLQDVIELERMESSWTKRGDIEIMAEGDVYPRPRINCPASYLEGFDTALRAAGCTDGILKYGLDYTSNADYETGYAVFHERNIPVYDAIKETFGDKTGCGVRIYEPMKKLSDMVMPTEINSDVNIEDMFFSKAARVLACNSIPSVYEGKGVCGIAFDENARNLPSSAFENGLILDIAAAEILTKRGVDVGLEKIVSALDDGNGSIVVGSEEHFLDDGNYISLIGAAVYNIKINQAAEILSDVETSAGKIPVSYRYENAEGQRFLVLNVNTRSDRSSMLRHYERGRQIAKNIPWLSGKELPAYSYGHPSLYVQCKKNENAMAVGLWNFFADTAVDPVVELDGAYDEIKFINCGGKLENNKVYLNDISPFAFAGFEVSMKNKIQ